MKKMNFKYISENLKEFVTCYQNYLIARNSFRQMKVDVIFYIEKYATYELQKKTIKIMFEQARSFMNKNAEIEIKELL